MSINKVAISGNLTRDCEVRSTQGGTTVISFGVAVNERRRNQQTGEWEDKPNFVDCVIFDKNGNRQWMANALRKGFKVFVEGALSYSSWTDRDTGRNRSKLEVIVRDIDANWPKREGGYRQPAPPAPPAPQYQPQAAPAPAYAPQQPPAYQQPQQPQYAPQAAYQQPQAAPAPTPAPAAPQQHAPAAPQQTQMAVTPQQGTVDVYDEDIPF